MTKYTEFLLSQPGLFKSDHITRFDCTYFEHEFVSAILWRYVSRKRMEVGPVIRG